MDNALDALLSTTPTADGYDGEFEELWARLLDTQPQPGPVTIATGPANRSATPGMTPTTVRACRRVPKVGTTIQRSSATNARKLQGLLETPPPPSRRVYGIAKSRPAAPRHTHNTGTSHTITELFGGTLSDLSDDEHPSEQPAPEHEGEVPKPTTEAMEPRPAGPNPRSNDPPPVMVTVSEKTIPVPYYAVHVSRRYKARVGNRRFLLRFDRAGKCRFHREL